MNTFSISCIDTLDYTPSINALKKTIETLFGKVNLQTVYWYSDIPFPEEIGIHVEWIKINKITDYVNDYNKITLQTIPMTVKESYNLIIHPDGFAVNSDAWDDKFLDYDYIGARWGDNIVGNGGFSLRSKKLYSKLLELNILGKILDLQNYYPDITYQDIHNYDSFGRKQLPEDNVICRLFRSELEQHGIKFCTCELVEKFSIEGIMSSEWLGKSLGFHGKHGIASYYNVTI